MKKFQITIFRLGIFLIIIGSAWSAVIFSQTSKETADFSLDNSNSGTMAIKLKESGIGFYFISSESYKNNILAKIIDPHGNLLDIRKITNKVTIDYFRFEHVDQVTLEITNLSDTPVKLSATLGDTKINEITPPTVLIFSGAVILVVIGYNKLKNYITAHPDEKRS